jgi:hypothetical protein
MASQVPAPVAEAHRVARRFARSLLAAPPPPPPRCLFFGVLFLFPRSGGFLASQLVQFTRLASQQMQARTVRRSHSPNFFSRDGAPRVSHVPLLSERLSAILSHCSPEAVLIYHGGSGG